VQDKLSPEMSGMKGESRVKTCSGASRYRECGASRFAIRGADVSITGAIRALQSTQRGTKKEPPTWNRRI